MRRLRLLVTTLMVVLILGMMIIVGTLVFRIGFAERPGGTDPGPITAETLRLPEGAEVLSLGRANGQVLALTRDPSGAETLRVLDAASGAEVSATPIERE